MATTPNAAAARSATQMSSRSTQRLRRLTTHTRGVIFIFGLICPTTVEFSPMRRGSSAPFCCPPCWPDGGGQRRLLRQFRLHQARPVLQRHNGQSRALERDIYDNPGGRRFAASPAACRFAVSPAAASPSPTRLGPCDIGTLSSAIYQLRRAQQRTRMV